MATRKNYGVMKYSKRPTSTHYAMYLSELFDLNNHDKLEQIVAREIEKIVPVIQERHRMERRVDDFIEQAKGIFIEGQLKKHGRPPLSKNIDTSKYEGLSTLQEIAHTIVKTYYEAGTGNQNAWENYLSTRDDKNATQKQIEQAYTQYQETCNKNNDMVDKLRSMGIATSHELRKIQNRMIKKSIKQETQQSDEDLQAEIDGARIPEATCEILDRTYKGKSEIDYVAGRANKYIKELPNDNDKGTDIQYVGNATEQGIEQSPLHKTLRKVLDTITGEVEIRSQERGFNRPSRFSHFVKGCFLPVYKSNKPRKRPAFYVDASGSMQEHRGPYRCITSAIGGFLRANHRKISELRPEYYAFASGGTAWKFDVKERTPLAFGCTSIGFVGTMNPKNTNIVITDAEFDTSEVAEARQYLKERPQLEVHWIVNNPYTYKKLAYAMRNVKNSKAYYCRF